MYEKNIVCDISVTILSIEFEALSLVKIRLDFTLPEMEQKKRMQGKGEGEEIAATWEDGKRERKRGRERDYETVAVYEMPP